MLAQYSQAHWDQVLCNEVSYDQQIILEMVKNSTPPCTAKMYCWDVGLGLRFPTTSHGEAKQCPNPEVILLVHHTLDSWNLYPKTCTSLTFSKTICCDRHVWLHTCQWHHLLLNQHDHSWIFWILFRLHHGKSYLGLMKSQPQELYIFGVVFWPLRQFVRHVLWTQSSKHNCNIL
jgi:hypothetical protein